jgi:hypothetical protein
MTPQHVMAEWNACRAWLVPALVADTEDEVMNDLILNRAQLWRGERSAMVTRLIAPGQLHVWLGGGNLRELLAMIAGVAAWGRMQGAQWATLKGRSGWARILTRFGFEDRGGELWKALT